VVAGQVHRPERVRAVLGLGDDAAVRLTPTHIAALAVHPEGGAKAAARVANGATLIPVLNKIERGHELALARLVARDWAAAGYVGLITAAGRADTPPVVERWAPWAVVILAAGESRRLGRAKQLLPVAGETMAHRAVRTALASGAHQVVLVTGAYGDAVAATVGDPDRADPRLRIVHNAGWQSGQAGSLQTGLAALDASIHAAIMLLVDQPFVPVALLRRLVSAWRQGAPLAAAAVDGEVRGAPALFDRSFWPALHAVRGDIGGRMVLRANLERVARVPAQAAWLADIDTPADLP
jgi:CTP:molybdopterin cytidylyltransferase MocA